MSIPGGLSGVINVYKEKGYTSHDVVAIIRKILKTKKVGHTGTLDPQAQGVLPVCVGRATKIASLITSEGKSYRAELILGITTDTGDITGTITNKIDEVNITEQKIREALNFFTGGYMQVPPMYSAVKVKGKKLYELARNGQTAERPARFVKISNITPGTFDGSKITMDIDCGKGTYIRSLCEDIGKRLGCGGCMGGLERTKSGVFTADKAMKLEEVEEAAKKNNFDFIIPIDRAFYAPAVETSVKSVLSGNPVKESNISASKKLEENKRYWLYCDKTLIGLHIFVNGTLKPEIMLYENHKKD